MFRDYLNFRISLLIQIFMLIAIAPASYASASASVSVEEIRLELGEFVAIKKIFKSVPKNIWIEHKQIISAEFENGQIVLKAKQIGFTQVRVDEKILRFFVMPPFTRNGLQKWKGGLSKLSAIEVNYCGVFICIGGNINSFETYREIISQMPDNLVPAFFRTSAPDSVQNAVRKFVLRELRAEGFISQRLIFSRTWRMYYNTKSVTDSLRKKLNSLGIELYSGNEYTELAENIEVEVKLIEAGRSFLRKWGLNWPTRIQAESNLATGVFDLKNFEYALNFAESEGEAKTLASPRLVTRNNKVADFFAGGEIPIRVTNHRSNRIEWRRFGIGLKIKPTLDSLGQFSIEIETEVSSVNHSIIVDDIPAIQSSRTLSHFDLIDGKTISLSGLIRNENSRSSEGIAFLKQIPILGELFQSRSFLDNKSELVILVTPRLAESEEITK